MAKRPRDPVQLAKRVFDDADPAATVRLWHEAKLPVNELPEVPTEAVN